MINISYILTPLNVPTYPKLHILDSPRSRVSPTLT
ncbi:hypothetical protein VPHD51_0095 [Vibrio phage D51]